MHVLLASWLVPALAQAPEPLSVAHEGIPWSLVGQTAIDRKWLRDWAKQEGFAAERGTDALMGPPRDLFQVSMEGGEVSGVLSRHGAVDRSGRPLLPLDLDWDDSPIDVLRKVGPAMDAGSELMWLVGDGCVLLASFDDLRHLDRLWLSFVPQTAAELRAKVSPMVDASQPGAWASPTAPPAPALVAAAPVPPPAPAAALPSIDVPVKTGAKAPNDAAVVVGLEDYLVIPDVPYARRDADAFYDLLVYTRGVPATKVQRLMEGGREHLVAAVKRAGEEVGPGGTVWVYFSGHGAANPATGERMLLGDDVRSDAIAFAARGVDVKELETLAGAHGGRPMFVLDTCYAGAGRSGQSILGGTRFAVPLYAIQATAGAQWNAAAPDEVAAPLDVTRHGAFTFFAVGAMRGWADGELDGRRDGVVTGEEARMYVQRSPRGIGQNGQNPVWVGDADLPLSFGATEQGPPL